MKLDEWTEAQRISDLPEVQELLQGFSDDPTGDNATMVVREVMRIMNAKLEVQAVAPAEVEQEPVFQIASDHKPSGWSDVSEMVYEAWTNQVWRKKRKLYTSPQAAHPTL